MPKTTIQGVLEGQALPVTGRVLCRMRMHSPFRGPTRETFPEQGFALVPPERKAPAGRRANGLQLSWLSAWEVEQESLIMLIEHFALFQSTGDIKPHLVPNIKFRPLIP